MAVGDSRRMLAGTDCGFDTSAGMGRVAEDVVWAKLRAFADGARRAEFPRIERIFSAGRPRSSGANVALS